MLSGDPAHDVLRRDSVDGVLAENPKHGVLSGRIQYLLYSTLFGL